MQTLKMSPRRKRWRIPVLGVEPARNVAEEARKKGVPTIAKFFGLDTARDLQTAGQQAELIVANNVLAHVPDLRDFVAGLKLALKPRGIITVEFPHLLRLMDENQFDTIYHEHLSYFSFCTAEEIFRKHRLTVFDVEEIQTHGGSGLTRDVGLAGMLAAARIARVAPVSREMILNFVSQHSLGLPKSY